MGLAVTLAAAASAQGSSSGGVGSGPEGGECRNTDLGKRVLQLGDCGPDVKTLNWILKSKPYGDRVRTKRDYVDPTERTVRAFQRRVDVRTSGVLTRRTHRKLARSMRSDTASWYGPGFWGNRTACGVRLERKTVGVAHRKLACGTRVVFRKGGRYLRTRVIDRGPYVRGVRWDLTRAAARKLGMDYTESVRSAIIR